MKHTEFDVFCRRRQRRTQHRILSLRQFTIRLANELAGREGLANDGSLLLAIVLGWEAGVGKDPQAQARGCGLSSQETSERVAYTELMVMADGTCVDLHIKHHTAFCWKLSVCLLLLRSRKKTSSTKMLR